MPVAGPPIARSRTGCRAVGVMAGYRLSTSRSVHEPMDLAAASIGSAQIAIGQCSPPAVLSVEPAQAGPDPVDAVVHAPTSFITALIPSVREHRV